MLSKRSRVRKRKNVCTTNMVYYYTVISFRTEKPMYFNDSLVCFSKKLFSALLSVVLFKKYCSENSEKLCCARQIQQQPDLCSGSNNICLARPNGLARQILCSPSHKSCMLLPSKKTRNNYLLFLFFSFCLGKKRDLAQTFELQQ